ncbi:MAG TPA: PEP-CTERM system histidine kinase PrsK, partial [Halieaceae bacterium]|nr:PEP-CTERM system histidine kinase PrsK [Halieaceae bacterium]
MTGNIGLITYLVAAVSFALLALLLVLQWRVRPLGTSLFLACTASALWSAIVGLGTLADYPPVQLIQVAELVRNIAWVYFL